MKTKGAKNKKRPAVCEVIKKAVEEGKNRKEILELTGLSNQMLYYFIKTHGLIRPDAKRKLGQADLLRNLMEKHNYHYQKIRDEFVSNGYTHANFSAAITSIGAKVKRTIEYK